MTDPKQVTEFRTSGFFAFRTPLLPFGEFRGWGDGVEAPGALDDSERLERACAEDRQLLRDRLRAITARPEVREGLFIASPSLDRNIGLWLRDPEKERGRKIERAVVRYFARMAGRATPFGLFAGSSVGAIGPESNLVIEARDRYKRHTRLDMDYLCSLTDALVGSPALKYALQYRPNSSLYHAAGRMRYVETRLVDQLRSHHLVAVETTEYLETTLERVKGGALPEDLAQSIVDADPQISFAESLEFIEELIDSQILVSELSPTVTGPEPVHGLVTHLNRYPAGKEAGERLDQTRRELDAIDRTVLGVEPERYRRIARNLESLPAKVELTRLYQVDMIKPAAGATLGKEVVDEIMMGVEILHRLTDTRGRDPMRNFREAFIARYEDREVPLDDVLDEEVGIGFERSEMPSAESSPLLEGLVFPSPSREETLPWGTRQALLLRKLGQALSEGAREIVLDETDLEKVETTSPIPLPGTFAVMASVAASSKEALNRGDFQLLIKVAAGPSGVNLLGRFCHADEALRSFVEKHLREEEALAPGALFAEIVHLPEGRIGNILARPVLRDYEIPFLGRSGAPRDRLIPVTDLRVSIAEGRVVLHSASLGREVIPRLTSAHNIAHPQNLGVYRFLCMLQGQGTAAGLGWDWGALESEPFLPRVVAGRLVLSRARWRIDKEELIAFGKARGAARFVKMQRWRARIGLPRFVALLDFDNELLIDLDNVLSVETLVHLVKDRQQALLVEMFPGPDRLCVQGPEGRFLHELVVPFVSTRPAGPGRPAPAAAKQPPIKDRFAPGSEWLYAKLYTGTSTADQVLRDLVGPVTEEAIRSGAADLWFFIRFGDPDWHIRLRIHGEPRMLHAEVLPALQAAAAPLLEDGRLWRVQYDTYVREVERYGGAAGVVLAERFFHADSRASLAIVEKISGDKGADARWRLAFRGIDMLLTDLGLGLDGKREVIKGAREAFGREFQADTTRLKHQLSEKFRKERKKLETLLNPAFDEENTLLPGLAVLSRRSDWLAPVIAGLKSAGGNEELTVSLSELAWSYIHMHANRMLRSAARAQELVIYDFLNRIYESRIARVRKKK